MRLKKKLPGIMLCTVGIILMVTTLPIRFWIALLGIALGSTGALFLVSVSGKGGC